MSEAVPEGWEIKRICDLVTLQYGKSPKEISASDGRYPIIGTGGIAGYTDHFLHEGNTTVIGRKGTIDKPSYVEGRFWAIDTTYYGSDYKGSDPKWFYYSLSGKDLTKHNEASGVPSLGRDTLYAIPVLTPPIPEQQEIATILSSVDDVIEKARAQIDKLKDLKTGMMQELLTQGIGHTQFKDSPVGRIPFEWDVYPLRELASFVTSGSRGWAKYYSKSGAPFIRIGNLTRDHINLRFTDTVYVRPPDSAEGRRTRVQVGDILISITADLGVIGVINDSIGEAYVNQHVSLVRLNEPSQARWVGHFLASDNSQKQFIANNDTGAKSGLNLTAIRNMQIAMPEEWERQKIVSLLDSTDSAVAEKEIKLGQALNLKKALMQDLLTGKVRVNIDQKESEVA